MSQIAIWLICGKYEWPAAASGHKAFIRENGLDYRIFTQVVTPSE